MLVKHLSEKSSISAKCLLPLAFLCFLAASCHGNQYDPHMYPAQGPFFEGFYMRLVDNTQKVSLGFLFGRVLPKSQTAAEEEGKALYFHPSSGSKRVGKFRNKDPLVLASVLMQDNSPQSLQSFNGAFPVSDYTVTVKGKPVSHNPDDKSPPDFKIQFGNNGSVLVNATTTMVNITIGNVKLWLQASNPVPWGPNGMGPEGTLVHTPLPLHWFVYSLRSTVDSYAFIDNTSGKTLKGQGAYLHMEKNWGGSFPPAWIWSEGISANNVTLALAGGVGNFFFLKVTSFLAGYRNPAKNIVMNFSPITLVSFLHDGCQGSVQLNLTTMMYKLALVITAPVSSFSECLLGPESFGFRPDCVESYVGVASIRAYERKGFHYVEVDRAEIANAALEFGGAFLCKERPCSEI